MKCGWKFVKHLNLYASVYLSILFILLFVISIFMYLYVFIIGKSYHVDVSKAIIVTPENEN